MSYAVASRNRPFSLLHFKRSAELSALKRRLKNETNRIGSAMPPAATGTANRRLERDANEHRNRTALSASTSWGVCDLQGEEEWGSPSCHDFIATACDQRGAVRERRV